MIAYAAAVRDCYLAGRAACLAHHAKVETCEIAEHPLPANPFADADAAHAWHIGWVDALRQVDLLYSRAAP